MLERETAVEVAVSTAGVLLFLVAVVVIGTTFGSDLTGQGAIALVGAMVVFVLFMAGVGYYLALRS